MILGYVENKAIGENLSKVLKSDQIKKYQTLSRNIVVTDYLEFAWINKDGIQRETLCHDTDLDNRRFRLREDRVAAVATLLEGFFSSAPEGIGRSQQLALALAARSKLLKDYLGLELVRQQEHEDQRGKLFGLYESFRDQVFHELTLNEFADAYAQMLAYGLFLARLNAKQGVVITLNNAREHVPGSFRLIQELVDFLTELNRSEYGDVKWVVEEVLSIVNGLDLTSIHEDLSFRQRKAISRKVRAGDEEEHRLFERDPFVYFYEDYLKAYDAATRKSRGVYYTPPPVVNFIVRAIDDILKDSFGIGDGLADSKKVTVLDFACGTGTFLLEVFQRIFENIGGADAGKADKVVREHLLEHIYGFEYLIAPYTIAHLKLSQYLQDKKHPLRGDERLQVFLTNTLEPVEPIANRLLPELTAETKAAQEIKEKRLLVITGNPPYSGHSKNKGPWVSSTINEYKYVWERNAEGLEERKPLGERNPKWLNDDYVKFIRFAQMKMDGFTFKTSAPDGKLIEHSVAGVEEGIVGIITNHSWLDNPTFRGMRQSLMRSFEQIYVLDLHGNAKKKERAPDGGKDENVFDIEQGVAISLFVKKPGLERSVWRGDLWGKRIAKYTVTADREMRSQDWTLLDPTAPLYLFLPQSPQRDEYDKGWDVTTIFPVNVLGFQSHRDDFAFGFTKSEVENRLTAFLAIRSDEDAAAKYFPGPHSEQPELREKRIAAVGALRERLSRLKDRNKYITLTSYFPFDDRYCIYNKAVVDRPRKELLQNVLGHETICLNTIRQTKQRDWRHALVSSLPTTPLFIETKDGSNVFPLWLHNSTAPNPTKFDGTKEPDPESSVKGEEKRENLSRDFRAFLDARYEHSYRPEQILGYIYAVLHAPTYRTRYTDYLRTGFPRIPFPERKADFDILSALGWELVQAHLLKTLPPLKLAELNGKGSDTVEAVRYSPQEQAVWFNATQNFRPVPQDVWDFHIGGYQALEKYLKSRKTRELSLAEIDHVRDIARSLAFTIEQMKKIDETYLAAFPAGG